MPDTSRTTPPADIPLSLLRPVRVRRNSGFAGMLWPFRSATPPILLVPWDGQQYGVQLGGRHDMAFFPVAADLSLDGVMAQGGEFRVDVGSRYDAMKRSDSLGALVLRGGLAFLAGTPAGDRFGDTARVPLWGASDGTGEDEDKDEDEDEAVGFTGWSVALRHRDEVFELWRQEALSET